MLFVFSSADKLKVSHRHVCSVVISRLNHDEWVHAKDEHNKILSLFCENLKDRDARGGFTNGG